MIEALALLVGATIPADVADMRAEVTKGVLQQCLAEYATDTYALGAEVTDALQAAKTTCFILYQDYRRTLQPIAERALADQGAKYYGMEVVESLVDEVYVKTIASIEGAIAQKLASIGSATD